MRATSVSAQEPAIRGYILRFLEVRRKRGGALRVAWRYPRPALELGVHGYQFDPSRGPFGQPLADSLDARSVDALVAASGERRGDGWRVRVGDYRIFYLADKTVRQIVVGVIAHRRDVYRR